MIIPRWRGSNLTAQGGLIHRYNQSYTQSMKTAVSLPDELFRSAEAAARRLRVSRSRLYAVAIAEFLQRGPSESITQRLDQIYARQPAKVDPVLHRAQMKSVSQERW